MSTDTLMAAGFSAAAARAVAGSADVDSGVTATGSAITDAYDIKATSTLFTTVASSTGAQLPDKDGKFYVFNGGAQSLSVYPHSSSGKINNGSDGAAKAVASGKGGMFIRLDGVNWGAIVD